ncbi:hypothetical protein R3P38DRAFT_3173218 [Favolaschia claudopus]|uniref:Uncharacterized protein n=1 Tax=Favolaschia claudopus TaxID=2862362 RepID=A0AAW0DE66_9AGAR
MSLRTLVAMQDSVKRMLWSAAVERDLRCMDDSELFQTSAITRMAGRNVHVWLGKRFDDTLRQDVLRPEIQDDFMSHPLNPARHRGVDPLVMNNLMRALLPPVSDYIVSPDDQRLRGLLVQYHISCNLESFGLYMGDLYLLHSVTGAVVSGEFVDCLLGHRPLSHRVDFYCARGEFVSVAKYLNYACGYCNQVSAFVFEGSGIRCEMVLQNAEGSEVRLVQSNSENPLHIVPGSVIAGPALLLQKEISTD